MKTTKLTRKFVSLHLLATGLLLALFTGCQHPGPRFDPYAPRTKTDPDFQMVCLTNRLDPSLFQPPRSAFTIGPGDRIEVDLMDETNTHTDLTVGPDGKIYYGLLPGMDVWGMTLPQVGESLQKGMAQFIREPPHVGVALRSVESKQFWILGRVQSPGVYVMTNATTLLEAVAMAGGTADLTGSKDAGASASTAVDATESMADLRRSFIVRKGKILPVDFQGLIERGDLSQNIYVEPDDFIYFMPATARQVYVIGAVGLPNTVPYVEGMTMMSAIANCLGTAKEAYLSHVAIVRGSLTQPKVAIVDYNEVLRGETPDILLQPRDIVYVPYEPYRYLVRYVNLIVNTFASSAAINGGVLALAPNLPPQTGVFIPVGSGVSIIPPPH